MTGLPVTLGGLATGLATTFAVGSGLTTLRFAAGFATTFALASGFPVLGLATAFLATSFFRAAGFADFALAAGRFADGRAVFLADGRAAFFGAAFLRSGLRAFALAAPRFGPAFGLAAAGFRDFDLAGDLRRGFAGFLAMVILTIQVPNAPDLGAIGKTSNYIICLFVAGAFPSGCGAPRDEPFRAAAAVPLPRR